MTYLFKRKPRFLPLLACLTAGSVQAAPDIAAPTLQQWSTGKAQALGFLPNGTGDERLAASKREGLLLLDKQGKTLSRVQGAFAGLDSRALGDQVLVAVGAERAAPAIPGADQEHVWSGDELRRLMTGPR